LFAATALVAVSQAGERVTTGRAPAAASQIAPTVAVDSLTRPDPSLLAEVSRLVEASLEALRDGRDFHHEAFLKESLEKLPDFAPARWHSGYVQLEGAWIHINQVPYVTSENPTLRQYELRRENADEKHFPKGRTVSAHSDRLVDRKVLPIGNETNLVRRVETHVTTTEQMTNSAAAAPEYVRAQESLARWCQRNGLIHEAQVHWTQVLEHEPANNEAAQALGLETFDGRLMTKEQIDNARRLKKDISLSLDKWHKTIVKLQREAASPNEQVRAAALNQLRAIDDPNAIFACEYVSLRHAPETGQRAAYLDGFNREVVNLIAADPSQHATESLVRHAVLHTSEKVRATAANHLRNREPHAFVPLLLAGLTMPIQYVFAIVEDPRGQRYVQTAALQEHESYITAMRDSRMPVNSEHLRHVALKARVQTKHVERFNVQVDQLNRRIVAALVGAIKIDADGPFSNLVATSEQDSPNPKQWWEWWYDYNEQYVSPEKPYREYVYDSSSYHTSQISRRTSCFAKGTPVWTLSGPKKIEEVKIGDRVLSQHPETGELTYKGVLATTLRPKSEMLTIRAGKTSVTTTLGHPFFVVGNGWRMAKQLKEDEWICAQGQTFPIRKITKAEPKEAHNLVVADFGTYFVGDDRLLVHDNSPIRPARLDMPGLAMAGK
jgi:hypothetical protein